MVSLENMKMPPLTACCTIAWNLPQIIQESYRFEKENLRAGGRILGPPTRREAALTERFGRNRIKIALRSGRARLLLRKGKQGQGG